MTTSSTPLSILDLSPVCEGSTPAQSFRNSLSLAQHGERLGYRRYWLAEHHGMPGIASAATSVLLAHIGAGTSTIRIGAGGVMLPNHSPLVIAEQFGTLESLYPGRIDLGLGRAPGSDQRTAQALRRDLQSDADQFPQDVIELMDFMSDTPRQSVLAVPGRGLKVPVWILGSSTFGAQLARPHVMLGFNVFAADTDAEARFQASSWQQAFVNLRSGRPGRLPPPVQGYRDNVGPAERALLDSVLSCSAVGSPETVREQVAAFIERTGADELMVTSQVFDHAARLRSYEILASVHQELTPA